MPKREIIIFLFTFLFVFSTGNLVAQTEGNRISVPGLKQEVTVRRDARSIPYIEAMNETDLYFIQGYVTASDRLWQMDLMRRLARGETAEIFGNASLEEDKKWRKYGFGAIAEETLKRVSVDLKGPLENYARGVNAYIETLTDQTLPAEFRILQYKPRRWTPADTIVIGKILAEALSSTWRNDLIRASVMSLPKEKIADLNDQVTPYDVILFGDDSVKVKTSSARSFIIPDEETLAAAARSEEIRARSLAMVGLYAEELAASNNWVIAGKRTKDGRTILANDPHLAATAPGIWYLSHLSTPTMRVSGVTIPGVPGITLGHNEYFAWGATNVGPDVQDLYFETFNEKGQYKTPKGWVTPKIRKEIINVRTSPARTETTPITIDVMETRNGVVITDEIGKNYSLKWTALEPANNEFETFIGINKAKNWDEFRSALKKYGGATQNFVYADVQGHIGWYAAGRIPIRKTGDGGLPYDGSTNEGDWIGYIPFEQLPHLYDPTNGLIVTANQRIVGTSYKYPQISRDSASPWRARRILDILDSKEKITFEDVREAQYDDLNMPLTNLAKAIVAANAASASTLETIKNWDGRMTADSKAALIVNEIRVCMANRIADSNKPVPSFLIRERILDKAIRDQTAYWLPKGVADYPSFMKACDESSRTALADPKRYGPDESKWTWGRAWQSRFPHPLAAVPFIGAQFMTPVVPMDGSGQTPNVGSSVSMRHITSPGNWDATRHVIPLGQSGDPRSTHFKDQFELWRTGEPALFPFTKAKVEAVATEVTVYSSR